MLLRGKIGLNLVSKASKLLGNLSLLSVLLVKNGLERCDQALEAALGQRAPGILRFLDPGSREKQIHDTSEQQQFVKFVSKKLKQCSKNEL